MLSWALASIRWLATISLVGSLLLVGLLARSNMQPLGREFMPPLDEGSILDMPVTIPRASITQVADDLKARDAEIRAFPEVELVVGKAGRAETPTDPAPPDMIETVINLRPREHWPKRELRYDDAVKQTDAVIHAMRRKGLLKADPALLDTLANDATMLAMQDFERDVRSQTLYEFAAFEQTLAPELTRSVVAHLVELLQEEGKLLRPVSAEVQLDLAQALAPGTVPRSSLHPIPACWDHWLKTLSNNWRTRSTLSPARRCSCCGLDWPRSSCAMRRKYSASRGPRIRICSWNSCSPSGICAGSVSSRS